MIPLRDNIRSSTPPVVTVAIIVICVVVFIVQALTPDHLQSYMFTPAHLLSLKTLAHENPLPIAATLLTSMFMHGSLMHLLFNMLFLWIFGDNVEDRMGHLRFLWFYLLCGILATFTHALLSFFSPVPVLGASGAIAGVLGAYYKLFRGARVRTLVPLLFIWTTLDLPAVIFLGLWFIFQLLSGLGNIGHSEGGVAFWAHIGGFVAGLLLVTLFAPGRPRPPKPRVVHIRYN